MARSTGRAWTDPAEEARGSLMCLVSRWPSREVKRILFLIERSPSTRKSSTPDLCAARMGARKLGVPQREAALEPRVLPASRSCRRFLGGRMRASTRLSERTAASTSGVRSLREGDRDRKRPPGSRGTRGPSPMRWRALRGGRGQSDRARSDGRHCDSSFQRALSEQCNRQPVAACCSSFRTPGG